MILADGVEEEETNCWLNPVCHAEQGMSNMLSEAGSNALSDIADAITEAVGQAVAAQGTSWLFFSTGELITSGTQSSGTAEPVAAPQSSAGLVDILEWVSWISLGVCVLSLIALGALMALRARRGEGGEYIGKIVPVLVASVLIGSASAIAAAVRGKGPSTAAAGPVLEVQQHLWWYIGAAVVLSVIVGAARMAWEQSAEPGKQLLASLITMTVVAGAGVSAVGLATRAADGFALWILFGEEGAVDSDFGDRVLALLALGGTTPGTGPGFGVMLVIILGACAAFVSLIQMILMLVRDGLLVVLVAVLPLAASFTNTEVGKTWFKKTCGWLIAFVLYKPAAAIVYAVAFEVIATTESTGGATLMNVLAGIALMVVALMALPALISLVVPAAGAAGGGAAAGALAGAAGVVGGQLASGAVDKASQMGSSGASGGETSASGQAPEGAQTAPANSTGTGTEEKPGTEAPGADDAKEPAAGDAEGGQPTGGQPTGGEQGTPSPEMGGDVASGTTGAADPYTMAIQKGVEAAQVGADTAQGVADEATGGPDGSQ